MLIPNAKPFHAFLVLAMLAFAAPSGATDGHVLHGVGPINQALGGAGIATSLDATGSNHNNVSSISFLPKNAIEFGAEVFIPDRSMTGEVSGQAAGTVHSKSRESVIPSFAAAGHLDDRWSVAISGNGIGGMGVDYPANAPNPSGNFNPLSAPQQFGGFGAIYSNYQLMQITPSVSYKVLPNLSLGLGANIDWSSLSVNPFPGTAPNASGYPSGSHSATAWGGGFTVGLTYRPLANLALGLSVKSPQWFSSFEWNSQYPDGAPTSFKYRLDYPMIIGAGLGWEPTEKLLLAGDVKWINYSDTEGFEKKNFQATPQGPYVRGFGWDDIFTVGLGLQYKLLPSLPVRIGYNYGGNPIGSNQQFFNVFAPAVAQHHLTAGFGYDLTSRVTVNVAYYHVFENSESGPFISNGGAGYPPINDPIPGTKVTNRLSEDSVSLQIAVGF